MTADTNIWVHTKKLKADGATIDKTTVSKVKFADYEKTTRDILTFDASDIQDDPDLADASMKVFVKGSDVSDILILETVTDAGVSNAFEVADKTSAAGIVIGSTTKKNADSDGLYVDTITIKEIDGTEVEYEASVEDLAVPVTGSYISLTLDKNSGEIVSIASNEWSWVSWLNEGKNYTKLTQIIDEDGQKIEADKTALIVKRSTSNGKTTYKPTTLNQVNTSTKAMTVEVHQAYYNDTDNIIYGDFIVVEEMDAVDARGTAEYAQDVAETGALEITLANTASATTATVTVGGGTGTVAAADHVKTTGTAQTWTVDGRVCTLTNAGSADGTGTCQVKITGTNESADRIITYAYVIDNTEHTVVLTQLSDTFEEHA